MTNLRITALAFAALSAAMASGTVSAMPADGLAPAAKQVGGGGQDFRGVGGRCPCWWTPGPYWGRRYWGPRPYWHHWGWHTTGGEFLAEGSAAPTGDPGG